MKIRQQASKHNKKTNYGFFPSLTSVKEDIVIKKIAYPEKVDSKGNDKQYAPLVKLRWRRIKKPKTIRPTKK